MDDEYSKISLIHHSLFLIHHYKKWARITDIITNTADATREV
jgi:hypothetical protein